MQALRTDWKVSNRGKSRPGTAPPPPPSPPLFHGRLDGRDNEPRISLRFYVRCSATQQSRETASGLTFSRAEAHSGMTKVSLLRSRH